MNDPICVTPRMRRHMVSIARWMLILGVFIVVTAAAVFALPETVLQEKFADAGERSLLAFELLSDLKVENRYVLHGYRFRNGKLLKKEKIIACNLDFAERTTQSIIDDRYLVSAHQVIDLEKKSIIHSEKHGGLLAVVDNKVIYSRGEKGVFSFDLKTHKVEKLDPPGKWGLPGTLSPDGSSSAYSTWEGQIIQHHLNGNETVLAENLRINYSELSSWVGDDVPLLWLDNQRILTQSENGKLIIVGTDKSQTPVVKCPSWEVVSTPSLYRDNAGQIVYFDCTIDVEKKAVASYKMVPIGHEFDVDNNLFKAGSDKREMRLRYRYQGKDIGTRWAIAWERDNVTTSGYLATFNYTSSDIVSPRGIAVWSTNEGWTNIDDPIHSLVGWVK